MAQVAPVLLVRKKFLNESPEAPQEAIQQAALITRPLDTPPIRTSLCEIEHHAAAKIDAYAVQPDKVANLSPNEIDELPVATSAPAVLVAIELRPPQKRPQHVVFRRSGLATMGLVGLFIALWPLNPTPHLGATVVATTDQAPVSVRVWTDPTLLERGQVATDTSSITPQPAQEVIAPTGLAVVQKAPTEEAPHIDLPADNRLVEPTFVTPVAVPREIVQSVSVASVPLPPRRPVSLLIQHMPVVHPVAITATVSSVAPTAPAVEQTAPPESYASFSARKHEIGTHKLPWGMARLHEDGNSDSGRGPAWDFVPNQP